MVLMVGDVETLDVALAERERVVRLLRGEAPRLRALGVTSLSLFGSMARGEAGQQSDVDLVVDVDPAAGFTLFDLIDLKDQLGALVGRPVDFAFRSKLRRRFGDEALRDTIDVF